MPVEEKLLTAVRAELGGEGVREVKMFGGVGFMLRGNLVVAASDRGLLVRVGPHAATDALTRKGASAMVMHGRTMAGYIRVEPSALDVRSIERWVRLGRAFVDTLPPKAAKASAKGGRAKANDSGNTNARAKGKSKDLPAK